MKLVIETHTGVKFFLMEDTIYCDAPKEEAINIIIEIIQNSDKNIAQQANKILRILIDKYIQIPIVYC